MILIIKPDADEQQVEKFSTDMQDRGFIVQEIRGQSTFMLGLAGDTSALDAETMMRNSIVQRVMKVQEPYKLAGRKFHPLDTVVEVKGQKIGGGHFAVIAGPCSVESEEQILSIAMDVKRSGGSFLRGGAFKPRTSPYAFQGLGLDGLELLKIAREKSGMPIVTELMSAEYLDAFARDVDVIQIGARNMQNFPLLHEVGKLGKPVLLKRGNACTIDELLLAAEHVMVGGSTQLMLCERGIRTFETATRNTLDLSAVPVLKQKTHLPIVVDPSHGTGVWELVEPLSLAAVAVGADSLIIEVHNQPELALCDGQQSITPELFHQLMQKIFQLRGMLEKWEA